MNSKPIEIKFEYQENIVTIKTEPYKTIKEVKQKAIKKFHNIPKNIHCFYLSRDLASYEKNLIGEFFNNREKVTLKLMPQKKPIFPISQRNKDNNEDSVFSDIYLNTKVYSSGFNNIGRFQNNKLKASNSLNSKDKKNKKKEELLLPPINKSSIIKKINNTKEILNKEYSLNLDSYDDKDKECQNCYNNLFSEYCRSCKEYVCPNCKKTDKHQNHLFIHLDSNYESNIKVFGKILLTDIEYFKINGININKNENIMNNCISDLNNKELILRHNDLINKLKNVIQMYESIIEKIKKEIINEGQSKIKEFISTYNSDSKKINEEINCLLKQVQIKTDKINIKEFKSFFEKLSENEEKLNTINKNIIKFQIISQINNKLVTMLDKIEQIINENFQENDNPFNLPKKYSIELANILNKNKRIAV